MQRTPFLVTAGIKTLPFLAHDPVEAIASFQEAIELRGSITTHDPDIGMSLFDSRHDLVYVCFDEDRKAIVGCYIHGQFIDQPTDEVYMRMANVIPLGLLPAWARGPLPMNLC